MIIILFDKSEIVVSQAEADGIIAGMNNGKKMFKVKGMVIAAGAIALIKPGGYSEADMVGRERRLAAPDHRGIPSPAKEALRKKYGVPSGE